MNATSNIVASALRSCVGSFSSNMAIDTKVSAENKVVYGFVIIFMMSMGLVAQAIPRKPVRIFYNMQVQRI